MFRLIIIPDIQLHDRGITMSADNYVLIFDSWPSEPIAA